MFMHTKLAGVEIRSEASRRSDTSKVSMSARVKKGKKAVTRQGAFGEEIVFEHKPAVKHKTDYFPDGFVCIEMIGCSGCGKSSLLVKLVPQFTGLKNVLVCSRITGGDAYDVYEQVEAWCDDNDIRYDFASDPMDALVALDDIANGAKYGPDECGLVILDDFSDQKSGRNEPFNNVVAKVGAMMRNYHLNSICITQSATNMPTLFRNNANVRVIFTMNDHNAVRSITQDVTMLNVPEKEWWDLYKLVQEQRHAYLWLKSAGQQSEVYIYLPEFGRDEPPRPVEGGSESTFTIEEDAILAKFVKRYKQLLAMRDALSRRQKQAIKEKIYQHVGHISRLKRMHVDVIFEEIDRIYGVDIR